MQSAFSVEAKNFTNGAQSVDNHLNYEGRIATFYWSVLARKFEKLQPNFHSVKHGSKSCSWNTNASDEVDALLNYGYAILESEIRKDINRWALTRLVAFCMTWQRARHH